MERFFVVLSLVFVANFAASNAYAFTYTDWLSATKDFKSGFVLGVMGSISQIVINESGDQQAVGFSKCFEENKITSKSGVAIVEAYLLRNGQVATTPMTANVFRALIEACKRYMPPAP